MPSIAGPSHVPAVGAASSQVPSGISPSHPSAVVRVSSTTSQVPSSIDLPAVSSPPTSENDLNTQKPGNDDVIYTSYTHYLPPPHNRLVINLLTIDCTSISLIPLDPNAIFLSDLVTSLVFSSLTPLVDSIVSETNRYAAQVGKEWSTTAEEIRAYFGFMILMGVNRLPEIRDYWSTDPALHYAPIADRISRDRFEEITRFLHFVDNTSLPAPGHPSYDRLQKVAPVLKEVNEACRRLYYPHCQLSVDEAMVAFKGQSSMKQYVPKKPIKRGFKIWVLADALNGYFCNIMPYTGATGSSPVHGLGEKVVLRLTTPYFGQNHHVYCDNFFTSIILLRHLLQHQTYGCGTIRSDRKFLPKEIITETKTLSRGGYVSRQDNKNPNIVATSWMDSKVVTVVSSMSSPEDTAVVSRKLKNGTKIDVSCPASVDLYNRYMGGVDKGDQLRKYYHVRMKTKKNYKYIFWFSVEVCITNSYILSHYNPQSSLPVSEANLKAF